MRGIRRPLFDAGSTEIGALPFEAVGGGGTVAYSLSCASGSYSVYGVASTRAFLRKLPAAAGTYAVTGVASSRVFTRKLDFSSGTYNYTGVAATLTYTASGASYTLDCASGSYGLTGIAASLRRARSLACTSGGYSLVGSASTLVRARKLPCSAGSYGLVGKNASLTYTPGTSRIDYTLAAVPGVYSIVGVSAKATLGVDMIIENPRPLTQAELDAIAANVVAALLANSATLTLPKFLALKD